MVAAAGFLLQAAVILLSPVARMAALPPSPATDAGAPAPQPAG